MASHHALGVYLGPHHSSSIPFSQFLGLLDCSMPFLAQFPLPAAPIPGGQALPQTPQPPALPPAALDFRVLPSRSWAEPRRLTCLFKGLHTVGPQQIILNKEMEYEA